MNIKNEPKSIPNSILVRNIGETSERRRRAKTQERKERGTVVVLTVGRQESWLGQPAPHLALERRGGKPHSNQVESDAERRLR